MWRADGLLCAPSAALELMSPAPFSLRLAGGATGVAGIASPREFFAKRMIPNVPCLS
jgi:hypothetical protein